MVKKKIIMDNAMELFAKQGFEATSIQQITDKCGISKGAFYLSFKSKDELISALIDAVMSDIVEEIEQLVIHNKPASQLLYDYYYVMFNSFNRHADFARLFTQEVPSNMNVEICEKLDYYNQFLTKVVETVVQKQFDYVASTMVPDLIFAIQIFSRGYGTLFLHGNHRVDIDLLCRALVEKTTAMAQNTTIPTVTVQWLYPNNNPELKLSKPQLLEFLMQHSEDIEDELICESLQLLHDHIVHPQLPLAVVQGLLKNLQSHTQGKWIAYIYEISDQS